MKGRGRPQLALVRRKEREVKEPQLAQGLAGAALETVTAAMQQGNAAAFAAALLFQTMEQRDAATAQRAHEAGRREMRLERKTNELQRKLEQVARKAAADGMQDSFKVTRAQQESQQLQRLSWLHGWVSPTLAQSSNRMAHRPIGVGNGLAL